MKNVVYTGIIVKTERHKDFNLRVSVFTKDGLLTFYATGALRPKAKFAGVLQLFNLCEITTNGFSIIGAVVNTNGFEITKHIQRYQLASSICDTIVKLFRDFSDNDCGSLFEAVSESMMVLATKTDESCFHVFIGFYGYLLSFLGYQDEEFVVMIDEVKQKGQMTLTEAKKLVSILVRSFREYCDHEIPYALELLNA